MANALYPLYKGFLLTAAADVSLNLNTVQDGPYCALTDSGTVAFNAAHDFYDDIVAATQGTPQRIANPTTASGLFDGDNVTFTAVSGNSVEALTFHRHNAGANTTWKLIAWIDTGQTGLPVTPNGGDIIVTFDAAGIFQL